MNTSTKNKPNKKTIELRDVYIEDIFEWMFNSVIRDSGDGGAYMICKNPEQARNMFLSWIKTEQPRCYDNFIASEHHTLETQVFLVNRDQEGFCFSDDLTHTNPWEYTFIILENCEFGWMEHTKDMHLIGIYNE